MFEESEFSEELGVALEAAEKAGEIMDRYAGGEAEIEGEKATVGDIYTEADLKCQEVIVEMITEAFPDDSFLAEEDLEYNEESEEGRRWIIDPVDGTSNFQRGLEYFCTSIAFEVEDETKLGVVYSPEEGLSKVFFAVKGEGAYTAQRPDDLEDAEKIEVSKVEDPRRGMVFSRISNLGDEYLDQKEAWSRLAGEGVNLRYMGAGALEICKVASGAGEGFISHTEARWDFAAAELVVREAGGKVEVEESQVPGKHRIIASNGEIQGLLKDVSLKFFE
jgi:myo-inositol-1(or 4)-monophosphatase